MSQVARLSLITPDSFAWRKCRWLEEHTPFLRSGTYVGPPPPAVAPSESSLPYVMRWVRRDAKCHWMVGGLVVNSNQDPKLLPSPPVAFVLVRPKST